MKRNSEGWIFEEREILAMIALKECFESRAELFNIATALAILNAPFDAEKMNTLGDKLVKTIEHIVAAGKILGLFSTETCLEVGKPISRPVSAAASAAAEAIAKAKGN